VPELFTESGPNAPAAGGLANRRPPLIYWLVSLALAGVLLYLSLRGIDWTEVWTVIRGADARVVAFAAGIYSLNLYLRAMRWRILLQAEAPVDRADAFWATATGYLGNTVLPARAGEAVRTLMISARTGMSRAYVLTTALSERVADAIVLITISSTVLLTLPEQPGWLAGAARPFTVLGLTGVAIIAFVPLFEAFWFRLLDRLPLPEKVRSGAGHLLKQGLQGIRSFHDRSRLARFIAMTGIIWFLDGALTVVGAHSIGMEIALPIAFLLVAGLGLGSALPSTPGYVGIYQFVAVSILTPFGHSRNNAIAYILLFQALSTVIIGFWGLIGLTRQRTRG
jgi:uncharacterized protein (TIRG00374 family)